MRTDRTTLCADCAVRFPAAEQCPRCGGTDLFDLRRARARRSALRAVQQARRRSRAARPWSDRLTSLYLRYGIVLLTALGALAGWRFGQTWVSVFVFGLGAFWTALALFFVGAGLAFLVTVVGRLLLGLSWAVVSWLTNRPGLPTRRRILTIDEQELLASPDVTELTGRVRALATMPSPLRHTPAVAWRLVGEGPVGDVDDAAAVPFELTLDDENGEETMRVEAPPASVALEVDATPRPVRPDRELAAFLETRGVHPRRGPVRLAEAVLEDGERVVVEGSLDRATVPQGYRGSREVRVLREHPGAPLVIRKRT